MNQTSIIVAAGLALAGVFSAAPAQAQNARSFVSGHGLDTNACTLAAPCRTFAAAFAVTNASGEIDVLDPAGYGTLTITKAISIQGHGFAGISVASGDAIDINAGATDKINLRGLLIDGVGTGGDGIVFNSGASLNVQDCLIRNFGGINKSRGILFQPTATSSLFVSDTVLADNRGPGIALHPVASSGTYTGVLEHVTVDNSGAVGLAIAGVSLTGTATLTVNIGNSVVANSTTNGIDARALSAAVAVVVRGSTIANSGGTGVLSVGPATTVLVSHSAITGNATGWAVQSSGTLSSYADNNIDDNAAGNTAPPSIPTK
jgi:hypothetical protein